MAVLNIKNLPDSLYKKLQARAKRQHRSVAQEVTHLLSDALETRKPLSILDLKGLGKEHWSRSPGVAEHVRREQGRMGLMADLGGGPVGVDTAIFIYFIEEHARFLPLVEQLFTEVSEEPQGVGYIGAYLARSPGRSLPFRRPSAGRAI